MRKWGDYSVYLSASEMRNFLRDPKRSPQTAPSLETLTPQVARRISSSVQGKELRIAKTRVPPEPRRTVMRRALRQYAPALLLALGLLALPSVGVAQALGTVAGNVRDASGRVCPA